MSAKRVWRAPWSVCSACRQSTLRGQTYRLFTTNTTRRDEGNGSSTPASTSRPAPAGGVQDALAGLVSSTKSQPGPRGARKAQSHSASGFANDAKAGPDGGIASTSSIPGPTATSRLPRSRTKAPNLRDILGGGFEADEELAKMGSQGPSEPLPPHRLYVYCHKRNTHLTLSQAPRLATATASSAISNTTTVAVERKKIVNTLLSKSTGQLGFKKAGRGSYDAAFQLGSYFLEQMKEKGMYRDLARLELVLRGFGPGREAIQKLILGPEGRFLKDRIVSIADATRLKIGGCRSPKPRRLG